MLAKDGDTSSGSDSPNEFEEEYTRSKKPAGKKTQLGQWTLSIVHQEGHLNSGLKRGWTIRMHTKETSDVGLLLFLVSCHCQNNN